MSKVSLTLNGKRVEVETGTTILAAAQQGGVEIPTLCDDPRLKPTAACRLCVVEVEGGRGPMPACTTPVQPGMVVKTNSDKLFKLRQTALELLLSDHYGDCVAPCKLACPAGIDIQGYIGLIAIGQYKEALKLIKASNPLPIICGRVCPRFCEAKCRRNAIDEPVSINALKRFVADYDIENGAYIPRPKSSTGHKVAIVGGGPAGLAAAYYTALEGHAVDIFDASPQLGGMLRYGIPEYRLLKADLDKEIAIITGLCHQVQCNVSLGRDFTVDSLKKDGYESIFVALGAWASQSMKVEGENLPGVLSGIGFLRDVVLGKKLNLGQRVAVIGGGNTAIDAARTALRLGATEVTIVYRRSRDEMPANHEEIEQAEQEGVKINFLAAPVKLTGQTGKVDSMECIRMALGEPDKSGRRRPEPITGSEFAMAVDTVIVAIGQNLDASGIPQNSQLTLDRWGYIKVDQNTMQTSLPGVMAGGDCVSGPATVVEAIAAGRKAAVSINQYLIGQPIRPVEKPYNCTKGELADIDVSEFADVVRIPRVQMPSLPLSERRGSFSEVELGLTEEMAKAETERCLACGCHDVFECKLRQMATEYRVNDHHYEGRKRHMPAEKRKHPYVSRDLNKCILCGRCVRICHEVQGVAALGFTRRGFGTAIEPALGMPLAETLCESCGQCISTCPTGAMAPVVRLPKSGPWKLKAVSTTCPYCGVGCNIELDVVGDKVVKITSPVGSVVNNGNLCKKGTFNAYVINDLNRLKTPLIKRDGKMVEASWDEAIALAAKGFKEIRERSGGDKLAVIASSRLTNEESYLVQRLARTAFKTNNLASPNPLAMNNSLMKSFGRNASTCSYSDIVDSDLVLIFGCNVTEEYPVIGLKVREAVANGSKLVMINPRPTRLDSLAEVSLKINPRTTLILLRAMLTYLVTRDLVDHEFVQSRTSGFEDFAEEMRKYPLEKVADTFWVKPSRLIEALHLYIRARRPVIIVNADTITPEELVLINNLALITGNVGREGAGIIAMRSTGNAQGLIDMGVHPDYLPGQQPIGDAAIRGTFEAAWNSALPQETGKDAMDIVQGVERGDIQGVLVLRRDVLTEIGNAVFEVPLFSVLVDTVFPQKGPYPDVILPGATFAESEGTFTNCERRIQRLNRAMPLIGGKENWEIISLLAKAMGFPMSYGSVSEITSEITGLAPIFKSGVSGGQWPFLENGRFGHEDGLARFCCFDCDDPGVTEEAGVSL
ncbi:MAG: NAD(P)-binding protein [Dehalococcoidia bacterium]|nr:NAD(P)-binding protein [Dehalococcoidia bacterium]